MKDFATKDNPLHASKIPMLLRCPLRVVLESQEARSSGKAADTGSAAHHMIASYHRGAGIAEAVERARAASPASFCLADLEQAEAWFRAYSRDPRNPAAAVLEVEKQVSVELPGGVFVVGTLDQLRPNDMGRASVWDVKSGEEDGNGMLGDYAGQIAAYAVMAGADPGGIIRLRDYGTKPRTPERKALLAQGMPVGVLHPAGFDLDQARVIMEQVRREVLAIRVGPPYRFAPGSYCKHCPALGVGNCLRRNT